MGLIEPPAAATWMLKHLVPGERNEAMAGDLLEEFRRGRSGNWYLRQILAAIVIGCFRDLIHHRMGLAYAAVWSILTPAWFVVIDKFRNDSTITGLIYRMDWPWSTICDLGLGAAVNVAFIGSGMFLYLIPRMLITGSFSVRRIRRGLFLILLVYAAFWAVLFGLFVLLPPGHGIDRHTLTPLNAVTNIWIWFGCLPLILALVCGLWGATSRRNGELTKIVAES